MTNHALMIAFHFPPFQGSSGLQRTLKFSTYLVDHGWRPIVLTVRPAAYSRISSAQLGEIHEEVIVRRTYALDTARHLSLFGRYPSFLALPDRWVSWWLSAVPAALQLIRRYRPQVIWSTFPIATAHLIGLTVHRLTGVPWVADFRDGMVDDNYPPLGTTTRLLHKWMERRIVNSCDRVVLTTPGSMKMYAQRYNSLPESRWTVIANGYDEDNFKQVEIKVPRRVSRREQLQLVHSGLLYPTSRDPKAFFAAVKSLAEDRKISSKSVRIVLRASGHDDYYGPLIAEYGLQDIVFLEPAVSYHDALAEMLSADGLLIFQASDCNHLIPAKLYEYMRAGKPILALTDPSGDTAGVLRAVGIDSIVPLDATAEIAEGLSRFIARIRNGDAPIAPIEETARFSRQALTGQLANLFDSLSLPVKD